jgi:tRNA(Ile)-lysidine synthase
MLKQFAQKIEDFKRLIGDSRSASFRHAGQHEGASVRFLLAVSGGMDSMCMLDLFSQVVPVEEFAVAHCNFSLRGAESDGDQELVESRARELGVQVFVKRFETEAFAREKGVSIEMAARELRYAWFAELCQEHEFGALVVAHNANDNAETLMLNLLRGTGLNGLHGMAEVTILSSNDGRFCDGEDMPPPARGCPKGAGVFGITNRPFNREKVLLFRPLLEVTRKQIEGYVMARRVAYRDDSTNFESDYKRNRIRNEVFPVFEKVNPSFVKTLNQEIGYFAEAGSIVEDWCRAQMPKVLLDSNQDCVTISLPALLETEHWRYLLYYILQSYGFNSATLESLESLLESDRTISGKRFESPSHILYTGRDSLVVRPVSINDISDRQRSDRDDMMTVRGEGVYNLNGVRWQVKVVEMTRDFSLKQPVGTVIMDADKMAFPFVCRAWRQGDWFVPFGLKGRKKVSDLFADLKFTQMDKAKALMIVDCRGDLAENQHVAGVLGYRIDDRYKVDQTTRNIILMTILNNTDTI